MSTYSPLFVGIAGAWFQAAVILVTEIAYPSHRSFVTAIFMCQYYVGSLLSAWLAFATRNLATCYLTLILNTIGITSTTQQTLINGFLQLWNLLMSIVGACLVDRAGRRTLFLACTTIMLASYILITALSGSLKTTGTSAVGTAVIPFLFIYHAGYNIAFTPLILAYPAEIWTFSLQAKGVAISAIENYLALLFHQFINPIAFEAISWKYYFDFLVILLAKLVTIYTTYPETHGYSLEEIAVIFDGESVHISPRAARMDVEKERMGKIEHAENA
ncbi:hypothetical protein NUU61_000219 [Penicillium alfredii]|uniref:Major facilitator superfamily (MFS) profile domain-containing protein n=1 Tax=Penicillium alfredii TaxID=1506179 RepID=A0A9W9G957_9EURO|nr:uncharacterized protein NUU61_000219 [Penicillium alfredii]KAJ5114460.1 hypothetical protein NUU61_000219 [Penicillium alfredii]